MKTLKITVIALAFVFSMLGWRAPTWAASLQIGRGVSGTFAAGNEKTEYTFDGKSGDKLTIAMNAIGGDIDPFVDLYDPQGHLIGEDDNGGGKDNALLNGVVLTADGTYKLAISNKRAGTAGKYSLLVSKQLAKGQLLYDGPQSHEAFQLTKAWNHTHVTYRVENTLSQFAPNDVKATIRQAFQAWASVTPLTFEEVTSGTSDIDIQFAPIDGPLNILGETCPPYNECSGQIQFDSQENWVLGQANGYDAISFLAVASHEFGHAIGLLHTSDTTALMYPEYNPNVLGPQSDDIQGVQRLYGPGNGVVRNPTPQPGNTSSSSSNPVVQGTLTDQRFTNFWDFDVNDGETVTITMKKNSGGLDPLLILLDANNHILAYDDDSGGSRDAALINVHFPRGGTYTVAATRYQQAQGFTTGDYTLSIQYGAISVSPNPNLTPTATPGQFGWLQAPGQSPWLTTTSATAPRS